MSAKGLAPGEAAVIVPPWAARDVRDGVCGKAWLESLETVIDGSGRCSRSVKWHKTGPMVKENHRCTLVRSFLLPGIW